MDVDITKVVEVLKRKIGELTLDNALLTVAVEDLNEQLLDANMKLTELTLKEQEENNGS